jgi:hypothetical protein
MHKKGLRSFPDSSRENSPLRESESILIKFQALLDVRICLDHLLGVCSDKG